MTHSISSNVSMPSLTHTLSHWLCSIIREKKETRAGGRGTFFSRSQRLCAIHADVFTFIGILWKLLCPSPVKMKFHHEFHFLSFLGIILFGNTTLIPPWASYFLFLVKRASFSDSVPLEVTLSLQATDSSLCLLLAWATSALCSDRICGPNSYICKFYSNLFNSYWPSHWDDFQLMAARSIIIFNFHLPAVPL